MLSLHPHKLNNIIMEKKVYCRDTKIITEKTKFYELPGNPKPCKIRYPDTDYDENGYPIGTPVDVVFEEVYDRLSEHYGFDVRTLL
ncbi:hypothetical protein Barb7_02768 [Bacteroidales bacterium Barb7]|nr:hypothetical protein Barb7_02768 [Bacteroidales bacterium Barb7]